MVMNNMYEDIGKILTNGLSLGIIAIDTEYRITLWNRWMEKHSSIRECDILGEDLFEKFPEIIERKKDYYIRECVRNKKSFILSPMIHQYLIGLNIVKEDSAIVMLQYVKVYPMLSHGAIIVIRDMTEQILYEKDILHLNKVLRGIRNVNQLITQIRTEEELLPKACQVLVDDIGYDCVWVGYVEDNASELRVKAMAGIGHGIGLSLSEYPEIIRRAIQSSEAQVLHKDTPEDRLLFSELSAKPACYLGCNAFCSLPLKVNDRSVGALNIHSKEKEAFLTEELDLLREVATDISFAITAIHERQQRRRAEKSLREHEAQLMMIQKMEAIGVLAAGIAHDFNNILQPMLGYAEISMEDAPKGSMLEKNMKEILTAGKRAKELVQSILAFGRKSEQTLEPVYVSTILKEALKFIRASLPSTIEIRYKIDKESKPILGNATQIYQIFINLFTNAYHAMENTGGILEVRMSNIRIDDQDMIHLTISDTGKGIEENIRQRIFEPYFTTKEQGKGTGLGLSIVYGIIMNHGGQIDFESVPGKGTTFTIFFPCTDTAMLNNRVETSGLQLKGNEHVLVIDDEQQIVNIFWKRLTGIGFCVTGVTSSIEALKVFREQPDSFDLVITDLTMPQMTGDRLAQEIFRIRPDIPIIMCTGYTSDIINEEKMKAMGIRKLIRKPLSVSEITEAIREVLRLP